MKWSIHINSRVNGETHTKTRHLEVPGTHGIADVRTVYAAAHKKWGVCEDDMLAVPTRDEKGTPSTYKAPWCRRTQNSEEE